MRISIRPSLREHVNRTADPGPSAVQNVGRSWPSLRPFATTRATVGTRSLTPEPPLNRESESFGGYVRGCGRKYGSYGCETVSRPKNREYARSLKRSPKLFSCQGLSKTTLKSVNFRASLTVVRSRVRCFRLAPRCEQLSSSGRRNTDRSKLLKNRGLRRVVRASGSMLSTRSNTPIPAGLPCR